MTGPAHCTKRMGRSSRHLQWLTLSRPASPSRRGEGTCGIVRQDKKTAVSEGYHYDNVPREMSECVHTSRHLFVVATPSIDFSVVELLNRISRAASESASSSELSLGLGLLGSKRICLREALLCVFEVKSRELGEFSSISFSRRQNTPLITLITVRHTRPSELFFCRPQFCATILLL